MQVNTIILIKNLREKLVKVFVSHLILRRNNFYYKFSFSLQL